MKGNSTELIISSIARFNLLLSYVSQIYYSAKLLNNVHLIEVIKLVIYWWPICLCLDNGDLEEGVGANHYILHC